MRYRKLGRTNLRVSEIGFGTQTIGGPTLLGKKQVGWGCTDDKTSLAALHACLDHGVTFIDTADVYGWGHAETLVGKAFKHHRDRLVIATKAGYRVGQNGAVFKDYSPGYLKQAVEASLRRLRTDYIDLFQLHSVPDDFEIPEQSLEALEGLREAGKIRYYGASVAKLGMGIPMVEAAQIYAIQVEYNLLHETPARALSPKALERGVGLVVKAPLGTGFLCGKYQEPGVRFPADDIRSNMPQAEVDEIIRKVRNLDFLVRSNRSMAQAAIQFLLADPAVSTVITGIRTPDQLVENVKAADSPPLSEEESRRVRELYECDFAL